MDIKQAKEEIRRTVLAYTERTPNGQLIIPSVHQRPILLMGPPGVGKTAILYQLAQELNIGLVAYTMTHHTRQSALGLPVIREKEYGGKPCTVTEYTMSEILAAVYDRMEQTGQQTGILFLDEINCVSETLMPAMLQLLQSKQFGTHRLPEGWLIVAAGNPPQYNQSARLFDTATMDRVRLLQIEENFPVWQAYARSRHLHPAILSYLTLNPEHFYSIQPHAHGRSFVTARGWEDLSQILTLYEKLGFSIEEALFGEYLQHEEIAASFAVFFRLFVTCREQLDLTAVLTGTVSATVPALQELRFDGRLAVIEFLLHALGGELSGWHETAGFAGSLDSFCRAAAGSISTAQENLSRREHALTVRKDCGVLSAQEETAEHQLIETVHRLLDPAGDLSALSAERDRQQETASRMAQTFSVHLENAMAFVRQSFGAGHELLIFLTQLEALPGSRRFLDASTTYSQLLAEVLPTGD